MNKSGNTYSIIDFSSKSANIKIEGDLTVTSNNIVSGFSNYNYAYIDRYTSSINNATIIFKITTSSDLSSFQDIMRFYPLAEVYIEGGLLRMWSETAYNEQNCGSISANTTYWVKYVIGDGYAKLSYSLDGTTYQHEVSLSNESYTMEYANIGYGASGIERPFTGSIDLNESSITINGQNFWKGVVDVPNNSLSEQNTISGKATQNIAINSSGNVSVIL